MKGFKPFFLDENKSLLTALRSLGSEILNETKHTAPEINVQADREWTQPKSSKRAKQSTSSLSSNKIYDKPDENKEAAHASPQTKEHSAEQSGNYLTILRTLKILVDR